MRKFEVTDRPAFFVLFCIAPAFHQSVLRIKCLNLLNTFFADNFFASNRYKDESQLLASILRLFHRACQGIFYNFLIKCLNIHINRIYVVYIARFIFFG